MNLEFIQENLMLLAPLLLLQVILLIAGLVDLLRRESEQVRWGTKWPWVFIILLINIIGPLVYFAFGRKD